MYRTLTAGLCVFALIGATLAPATAHADRRNDSHRRSRSGTQWNEIAIGSAVLGAVGVVTHNKDLAVLGVAGALYSAYRSENDHGRKWRGQDCDLDRFPNGTFRRESDWRRDRNGRDRFRGPDRDQRDGSRETGRWR